MYAASLLMSSSVDATSDDASLFARSRGGDVAAFGHLIERHHNLVCAIAYSRTGDRAISEDVAQETFLAAWKGLSGLREPEKLRGWLCGIARNLAEKSTRSRRREVVDVTTIEGELAGDQGPLSAMLTKEIETTVWAALEELPETYREPLVLFYREQQSIKQVADGLGLSEDTAKQRLSRGRQSLRESVAELVEKTLQEGRPRKAATAAVLAAILAAQSSTPAAAATRAADAAGRTSRWKLAAIGAAACTVAGVAIVVLSREPKPAGSTPGADQRSLVEKLRSEHEAWKTRANGARTCELRGSIKRADGSTLAGGLVALVENGYQAATLDPTFVETAANGSWKQTVSAGEYTVTISAPGQRAQMATVTCVQAGVADVDIQLANAGPTLRGTITDTGGGPVAGAVVWLLETERMSSIFVTRSGADGSYELGVNPGLYSALAYHPDYALEVRPVTLGPAGTREDVTMLPGGSIEGTVVDGTGAPVVGAKVSTLAPSPQALDDAPLRWQLATTYGAMIPVVTDGSGRFRLLGLPPGTVKLVARMGALASQTPTSLELTLAEQQTGVTLSVHRARTIAGFVVGRGAEQRGLAAVQLVAISEQAPVAMPVLTTTDGSGYFELQGLAPGPYRIAAVSRGWVPQFSDALSVEARDVSDHLIVLDRGATLRGHVEPAASATVKLQPAEANASAWIIAALTRAEIDDRGNFTIAGVAPGAYVLAATTFEGRGERSITVARADQTDVSIQLDPRPSIAGRVIDESGAPLVGALISATPRGHQAPSPFATMHTTVRSDEQGAFRIVGVTPGVYDVRVFDARGQRPWTGKEARAYKPRRIEAGAGTVNETLEVRRGGNRIAGIVVGPDKLPVADAWIDVRSRDARTRPAFFPAPPIVTDANGRFAIDGVFGDRLLLDATGPNGTLRASAIANPPTPTKLVLQPLATLDGTVTKDGQPLAAFEVRLENTVTEASKQSRGTAGRFTLQAVAGEHELLITSALGYAKQTLNLSDRNTVDIALLPWGKVRGRVVGADGKPWVNASVLGSDSVEPTFAKTDVQGAFTLDRMIAGKHALSIHLGGDFVRYELELAPGQELDLETIDASCDDVFACLAKKTTASASADLGLVFYVSVDAPTTAKLAAVKRDPLEATREGKDPKSALWIASVDANGHGARAGLRAGDRVTAVGMSPVGGGKSAVAMLMSLSQPWRSRGRTVGWKVVRDGRELSIDILLPE